MEIENHTPSGGETKSQPFGVSRTYDEVSRVPVLSQGTHRGDAFCASLFLFCVGSIPVASTFDAECDALSVPAGIMTLGSHMVLACGAATYTMLMNMGDTALYSAIVTLHVVVPVTLGIVVLGESLNTTQYNGVALCCLAAFVLGGCDSK